MKLQLFTSIIVLFCLPLAQGNEPVFMVRDKLGTVSTGTIERWTTAVQMEMVSAEGQNITINNPVYLSRKNSFVPSFPDNNTLWLINDDCLRFTNLLMKEDRFEFESPGIYSEANARLSVPLIDTKLIWVKQPLGVLNPEVFRSKLLVELRIKDALVFNNGERVEGVLESLDAKNLSLDNGVAKSQFKVDSVGVIGLSQDDNVKKEKKNGAITLIMTSGSRITLAEFSLSKGMIEGKNMQGLAVKVSLEKVEHAVVFHKNAIRITELKNIKVTRSPFFSDPIVYNLLLSNSFSDFLSSGASHSHGFSTLGNSTFSIPLEGKFQRICGEFGFDNLDGRRGRADVKIIQDGKTVKQWLGSSWKDGPQYFNIPLADAKELTVVIETSPGSKINWCECLLFKSD